MRTSLIGPGIEASLYGSGEASRVAVGPNKAVSKWHCQVRVFSMICGVRSDLESCIRHAVSEARDPDIR